MLAWPTPIPSVSTDYATSLQCITSIALHAIMQPCLLGSAQGLGQYLSFTGCSLFQSEEQLREPRTVSALYQ